MGFEDECRKADKRYKYGKAPTAIDPERWDVAREVKDKLKRGRIPSSWDRPEWSLERLWRHFQHLAEQGKRSERRAVRKRRRPLVP